jgi:Ser-tRNA(Ala) deacylase AlaX
MATKLVYLEGFDVVDCEAKVLDVQVNEDGRRDVVLDQTCFYPRGGGQDGDTGTIGGFAVGEVRLDEAGVVHHLGKGTIAVGEQVKCRVDTERRAINTRLHSAGHLLDMAMTKIRPDWTPGRGAHYPHMSFVEYDAPAETVIDEAFKTELQDTINLLSKSDYHNQIKFVDKDGLAQYCRHIPDNIPTNKPSRIVLYADDFGIPCGGTHAKQVKDIGNVDITKIKVKKGIAKVSYAVKGVT